MNEPLRSKKKRSTRKNSPVIDTSDSSGRPEIRRSDSIFLIRLKYLRSQGIEPDLNERVSNEYLFSPADYGKTRSIITLSRESFLKIGFDNDILDYTDRFYTNGIKIALITPGLNKNPVSRILLPYHRSGMNYYGISLVQNMFTPSTTKTGGILYGDRPYAAYLYIGSFKITNDSVHKFRQTSELDAGIIGPNSYGEWVQRSFHNAVPTNNEPLGWEFQIQNDLVLNYSAGIEQGILSSRNVEIIVSANGSLGTLQTNLSGGGMIRAGLLNPYFANLGLAKKALLQKAGLRNIQFYIFLKGSGELVGYDATLQGGLFNKSSSYTLSSGQISRAVFHGSGGLTFTYNGISLDVEQFMLSPEFHDGWWHKWVHIALTFCL
ncbi:MAG: lipid A deacylase LpxR family protein [Bacteroidales bacterium]